jgi:exopolysaccharide biosynthesis polyprenyl glycosylphosphotransferase
VRLGSRAFIRVFPKPLGVSQRMLKRAFDILGSAFLVCVLFPVLLALAVLVKVSSPGPIFFRQSRTGFRGEPFVMFKFRTMRVDAQDVLGVKATTRDDPRVTRIGAFLRRSSLDELPQLFNVLWGSMSLVGPRPHAMNSSHFRAEIDNYDARHPVKPGVTGLAQVLGWRGLVSTPQEIEQRVANDLQYISSWTFAKDIQILMQTVIAVFSRKNAF